MHQAGEREPFAWDDFFFIGAGIVPVVLLLGGELEPAALCSVLLMLAGVLAAALAPHAAATPARRSDGAPRSASRATSRTDERPAGRRPRR